MYGPLNTGKLSSVDAFLAVEEDELLELPNGSVLNFKAHIPNGVAQLNEGSLHCYSVIVVSCCFYSCSAS